MDVDGRWWKKEELNEKDIWTRSQGKSKMTDISGLENWYKVNFIHEKSVSTEPALDPLSPSLPSPLPLALSPK